jgi:alkylation response protein AidB-like acyl-CoA dehydrogenase
MYLTDTHIQVRDMARSFAETVLRPVAADLDRDERFPSEIYEQMAELGLFGIGVPEQFGGPGFDTLTYALVMEELSRGLLDLPRFDSASLMRKSSHQVSSCSQRRAGRAAPMCKLRPGSFRTAATLS